VTYGSWYFYDNPWMREKKSENYLTKKYLNRWIISARLETLFGYG